MLIDRPCFYALYESGTRSETNLIDSVLVLGPGREQVRAVGFSL